MRIVGLIVASLILSLACYGTYVVQADAARGLRGAYLGMLQGQTVKALTDVASGQSSSLPPSKDLEAVARKGLKAFEQQSFDGLFNLLPTWRKEKYGLLQERAKAAVEDDNEKARADFGKLYKSKDPGNILKLKDKDSFMNLTRAQFCALSTDLLTIHINAHVITAASGQWFMVNVTTGWLTKMPDPSQMTAVIESGAVVTFENVAGNTIVFTFTVVDNQWVLTDWHAKIGEFESRSAEDDYLSAATNEAKSSEARAALGTIKDRLRVKYIQNNNSVNTKWTLSDLVNTAELSGKYYGAADYSMTALAENTATFKAAANTQTRAPQVTMSITNIQTGAATLTSP
ncbi:MAG: hypothetical protein IT462_02010 [Planctomycetes bacterium]|nr:hypothetical protein [Planctomycetota bacterium]